MESDVLTIAFGKSTSVNYEHAVKAAKKFKNYAVKDGITKIRIAADEVLDKISPIEKLFLLIEKWKHAEIALNDKRLTIGQIHNLPRVIKCAKRHMRFSDNSYCHKNNEEGWGCKFLDKIPRRIPESDSEYRYLKFSILWFNFGHFEDDCWVVNKKAIKQKLLEEAEYKSLDICPHFDLQNIENILKAFPEKINVETDKDWCADFQDVNTGYSLERKKVGIIPRKVQKDRERIAENPHRPSIGYGVRAPLNGENEGIKSQARNIPNVTFDEIGGLGDSLIKIREVIELPMMQPEMFKHVGVVPHKGILMCGPPGCGKTLIAKAIANEIKAHLIDIKGPELMNKWIGQSEENLRAVFNEAREFAPSIIFFDEFDSIGGKRSGDDVAIHTSRFVNQLLTLIDGFEEYSNVKVIAATNRRELLDAALLRPGRFDYILEIKLPTLEGCKEIFKIHTRKMSFKKFDLDEFAEKLVGFSGAEIGFVAREAGLNCIRRIVATKHPLGLDSLMTSNSIPDLKDFEVLEEDFIKALSIAKKDRIV